MARRETLKVGKPHTESRLSLSKITWMRLRGRYLASVLSPPRFISTEPSPSMTMTRASGRANRSESTDGS